MESDSQKLNLPVEKSDLKYIFDELLKAQLLTEAEYKKTIEKLNSYTIKENPS